MIETIPTVEKPLAFLDYNVFVDSVTNDVLYNNLKDIASAGAYILPFTRVHVEEVNRIRSSTRDRDVHNQLTRIREITLCNYLDYRTHLRAFTVRAEDPFTVFATINEVPQEFLREISRAAIEDRLCPGIPGLPAGLSSMDEVYEQLTRMFRGYYPNLGEKLNGLSAKDAIAYIEKNVLTGLSFQYLYEVMPSSSKVCQVTGEEFTIEAFTERMLYIMGYKTPAKELKKPSGMLSDQMHLRFACRCPIVISNDLNFRRKVIARSEPGSRLVTDTSSGIALLLLNTGLIELVDKESGESRSKMYVELLFQKMRAES